MLQKLNPVRFFYPRPAGASEPKNIALLTIGSEPEGDQRLQDAAKKRGHNLTLINYLECSLRACYQDPRVFYEGEDISHSFDVILPRVDTPYVSHGLAIVHQFQAMGVPVTETARGIAAGHDKLRCTQNLVLKGVPVPVTGFAWSKESYDDIIKTVGGPPLVIKLAEGTEGVGVFLLRDEKEAKNILSTLHGLEARLIVQEFIEESQGEDIRSFVVGGKIIANMRRESQDGDFRANVAQGANAFEVELAPDEEKVVLKAIKALGANIAGVDLIRSSKGPLVIEVNTSPFFTGVQGIENVTGIDIAGCMIDYAVFCAERGEKEHAELA